MKKMNIVLFSLAFMAALLLSAQSAWASAAAVSSNGTAAVTIEDPITGSGPNGANVVTGLDFGRMLVDAVVTVSADGATIGGTGFIDGGSNGQMEINGSATVHLDANDPGPGACTGTGVAGEVVLSALTTTVSSVSAPGDTVGVGGTVTATDATAGAWSCTFAIGLDYVQ